MKKSDLVKIIKETIKEQRGQEGIPPGMENMTIRDIENAVNSNNGPKTWFVDFLTLLWTVYLYGEANNWTSWPWNNRPTEPGKPPVKRNV
jgi:hypothetical protein